MKVSPLAILGGVVVLGTGALLLAGDGEGGGDLELDRLDLEELGVDGDEPRTKRNTKRKALGVVTVKIPSTVVASDGVSAIPLPKTALRGHRYKITYDLETRPVEVVLHNSGLGGIESGRRVYPDARVCDFGCDTLPSKLATGHGGKLQIVLLVGKNGEVLSSDVRNRPIDTGIEVQIGGGKDHPTMRSLVPSWSAHANNKEIVWTRTTHSDSRQAIPKWWEDDHFFWLAGGDEVAVYRIAGEATVQIESEKNPGGGQ